MRSAAFILIAGFTSAAVAQSAKPVGRRRAAVTSKTITVSEATDSQITVSPDHKTILMDLQGVIYSLPFSGGPGKRITRVIDEASHPDWSPKGDFVAIQSYAGGTFHIWTMKPDGTGLKQITKGHGDDREPKISPDGKTIVFASDRAFKGSYDVWTVDIASGETKQITSSELDEFEPNWSPDGSSVVFVSGTGIVCQSSRAGRPCLGEAHHARFHRSHERPPRRSVVFARRQAALVHAVLRQRAVS